MPVAFSVDPETLRKFKLWFKIYGGILILLGAIAIILPGIATLATTITVGWLLIAGGIFRSDLGVSVRHRLAGLLVESPDRDPVRGRWRRDPVQSDPGRAHPDHHPGGLSAGHRHCQSLHGLPLPHVHPEGLGLHAVLGAGRYCAGRDHLCRPARSAIWVLGLLVGINLLFTGVALITAAIHCESANTPPEPSAAAKA
jgi:uncharacterized membrane protein HdeD (DUF308 family)